MLVMKQCHIICAQYRWSKKCHKLWYRWWAGVVHGEWGKKNLGLILILWWNAYKTRAYQEKIAIFSLQLRWHPRVLMTCCFTSQNPEALLGRVVCQKRQLQAATTPRTIKLTHILTNRHSQKSHSTRFTQTNHRHAVRIIEEKMRWVKCV